MKKRVAGLILAGVAATGVGLSVAGTAFADPSAAPSTATAPGTTSSTQGQGPRGDHHKRETEMAAQLAQKLGVDQAKVTDALQALRADRHKQGSGQQTTPGQRPDPAARQAELAKELAARLGLDEAKVNQALTEIRDANKAKRQAAFRTRLDDAVTAGKLTRAEADAVLKAADAGVIPMAGR